MPPVRSRAEEEGVGTRIDIQAGAYSGNALYRGAVLSRLRVREADAEIVYEKAQAGPTAPAPESGELTTPSPRMTPPRPGEGEGGQPAGASHPSYASTQPVIMSTRLRL